MEKHTAYYELVDKLAESGCVICRLTLHAVQQFIDSLVYEYANKPPTHKRVRQARGFCNLHAWQLGDQRGAVTDLAILGRTALKSSLEVLQSMAEPTSESPAGAIQQLRAALRSNSGRPDVERIAQALEPTAECPICQVRHEAEMGALDTLFKYIDEPEIIDHLPQAGGLCWPHVRLALRRPVDQARLHSLLRLQRQAGEQLLAELDEFIRKQDYRFKDEGIGSEGDSWRRALGQIAGLRNVW